MTPRPRPKATRKKVVAPLTSGPNNGAVKNAIAAKRIGNNNFLITYVTSFRLIYL